MAQKQPYIYLILSLFSLFFAADIVDILGLGRYCSIIMRLWSVYHLFQIVNHGYLKGPLRYFSLFVLVLIMYSVPPALHGVSYEVGYSTVTAANYLNSSWMYACPVYSFYWFAKKGLINNQFIRFLTVCGVVYCISFFISINKSFSETAGNFGNANNSSYVFLQLIPLLVYFGSKRRLQYLLLLFIFISIVVSSKRGALLIALVSFFVFYVSNANMANKKERADAAGVAFFSILIYVGFIFYEYQHNSYFNERVLSVFDNDSSGRGDYYSTLWSFYKSVFSVTDKLFGRGIYSTIPIIGNYAHNDWLEYLISFGLFGCSIYLLYFISLFRFYRKVKRFNNEQTKSLLITLIILFMSTLFSMSYTGMTVFIAFSLGYSISYLERYIPNRK